MSRFTADRHLTRAVFAATAATAILVPAVAVHAQADGTGALPLERRVLDVERRVVPYDGRVQETDGDEVTVSLDGDVLFELDSDALTPSAQTTLTDLATQLDDTAVGAVAVVGHTDALGTDEYNLDLSLRRARNVRDFLVTAVEKNLEFTVDGRGESEPVASNTLEDGSDNPDGRRRNRRVEIIYTAVIDE